jgi:hypothetical protein
MGRRVAVLFGRRDGAPLVEDGMTALNRGAQGLAPALETLGYSTAALRSLSWRLHSEPETGAMWWYWEHDMDRKIALPITVGMKGCCLETGVLWKSFLDAAQVRSSCLRLVKDTATFFGADAAVFAPDSGQLYNSGCSRLREGAPFDEVLDSLNDPKVNVVRNLQAGAAAGMAFSSIGTDEPEAFVVCW